MIILVFRAPSPRLRLWWNGITKQRQATLPLISAGMMELVDMRDLGSRAVMRWGSSPHARTNKKVTFVYQDKGDFFE